jgi:plastocyanin
MRKLLLAVVPALVALAAFGAISSQADHGRRDHARAQAHQVTVPGEDRFTPFALTIHTGDSVTWANHDTDDHTVVSDDAFDTAGHRGTNASLPAGGTFTLHFSHPGTFVYYCRLHAHLDGSNQPVAPGPDGGIQDSNGNFGTPMSGVITVLPGGGQDNGQG